MNNDIDSWFCNRNTIGKDVSFAFISHYATPTQYVTDFIVMDNTWFSLLLAKKCSSAYCKFPSLIFVFEIRFCKIHMRLLKFF